MKTLGYILLGVGLIGMGLSFLLPVSNHVQAVGVLEGGLDLPTSLPSVVKIANRAMLHLTCGVLAIVGAVLLMAGNLKERL